MKQFLLVFLVVFNFSCINSQENYINHSKIKEDLNKIIGDLETNYVYLDDKEVDLNCIRDYYESQIKYVKTEEETVLLFEYLLNEFYDSHLILNTNRSSSYRLSAPIYASVKNGKILVSSVWKTQILGLVPQIIEAEILKINTVDFSEAIEKFPTHCSDKNNEVVREWIANKVLAGQYNEPRVLTLKLKSGKTTTLDLDKIQIRVEPYYLTSKRFDNIGVIRINNALGKDVLVTEFDRALDSLMDTEGLIIDLRNTVDGGNSYVARGIMGRFIEESKPYQKHLFLEKSKDNPNVNPVITRSWIEYVEPRGETYKKPVVVLVGRWTGSMGEGLAIGFEGMRRGEIVGSEMEKLAGGVSSFSFKNQTYGYRISTERLFHINGIARELYVPTHFISQTSAMKDEVLEKGIKLINNE
ncbi:S41 family peptidase [Algibacter sp. L4_22]|uniref:S41 family peptidase n=1 Tax=Algibacter sp. L4_22 TaxID=2942477 RepID=UPI00201B90C2|nr:S41 family peptidase [Algibacter sp. L4_22]MCL5127094.1 S41 family peptidase [Algibacter sp. L4_22]